jgi:hypothetical protein
MRLAAEQVEHPTGLISVCRFAEDLCRALGHGVATHDDPPGDRSASRAQLVGYVGGLLPGQSRNELAGSFPAANATLGLGPWRDDLNAVSVIGQQAFALR